MHELMHGLGPHNITVGGRATTVREELKETYSALEEAKADISGLWALQYLVDKGDARQVAGAHDVHDVPGLVPSAPSASASPRRTARASPSSSTPCSTRARSRSTPTAPSPWTTRGSRTAVAELTRELMTLQAEGDYARATRAAGHDGGGAAGGAARARPPEGGAGGHRAAVHRPRTSWRASKLRLATHRATSPAREAGQDGGAY